MKIVLDTNILLVSLPSVSKYAPIIDALYNDTINLVISTSIYFEYIEMLKSKAKKEIAGAFEDYLKVSKNILINIPYYQWQLITIDPDE